MPIAAAEQGEINRLPCVFEKALLAHCAVCELARRRGGMAREGVACASPVARAACGTLYGLLRRNAAFALRAGETSRLRPGAVLKLQCGGLTGLKQLLAPDSHAPYVHGLVRLATDAHGDLDTLPFADIVKAVTAWPGR